MSALPLGTTRKSAASNVGFVLALMAGAFVAALVLVAGNGKIV
ncbi:MAG: hypothetical protein H6Q89_4368, partial [Myxococcaceae bacterium]|nr:hypothetical protein [Myxococcaceae bacterium]